nr:fumarylacetoacetate hydrolase family protein [Sphingomonas sp. Y57]
MKLIQFATDSGAELRQGLLTSRGAVDVSPLIQSGHNPQEKMQWLIDNFENLRPALKEQEAGGEAIPVDMVRLGPPLPRPGKIVNCIANYWEHAQREPRELNMFLKNSDAVVGPGDVVRLPEFTEPWAFMHEAELAVIFRGPSKYVSEENWRDAVFGYTCMIDVTARGEGRFTWKKGSWMGKSFDTFAPIGPCIVTADEIADPNDLHVQFWNDGQLRHNYNTDDMEHRVPELVAFVTSFMTMNSGDVLSCGTNHEGLGFIQHGETLEISIQGIGSMKLTVDDPLRRSWERGIYMGEDSTHHEAVRRYRPDTVLRPSDASIDS